ncbi:hypothetical protein DMC47_07155 [Nostoc sp. 3335mG]|nr:hypothetical protein DMC47_07155 [Nostoc sp. 3335mG]
MIQQADGEIPESMASTCRDWIKVRQMTGEPISGLTGAGVTPILPDLDPSMSERGGGPRMDLLAPETLPFAVALALTLAIALIELAGVLIGLSPSEAIDSTLPDADAPDIELGPLSQFLNWLSFGRLPALVVLIVATTSFGLSGFVLQEAMRRLLGFLLDPAVASVPAVIIAIYLTHHLGHALSRIMPREETDAVSSAEFIGRVATVFRGTANSGMPAEAKLTDIHGKTHYVLVEPEDTALSLPEGSEVVLIGREGPVFRAIVKLKPVA